MIAARLQCRRLKPLFTEGQWLRIADRLEFSRREIEIVWLVFQDAPDQAIAAELAISVNTVHTHLKRLYSKLGVRSRVGLVLQITHEHLADSQDAQRFEPTELLQSGARRAA
jgi:DNA-binding CsgD family transcriptional regulator